jgi:hypothetical protein
MPMQFGKGNVIVGFHAFKMLFRQLQLRAPIQPQGWLDGGGGFRIFEGGFTVKK